MDSIDNIHLLAELENEFCELNHGPGTDRKNYPASDYLVAPFGYSEDEIHEVITRELVIPVCFECTMALMEEEWTLIFCFACSSNHWINRELAKNMYHHQILWLNGCPECTHEFGGLYFTDLPVLTGYPHFLTQHVSLTAP